jgi:hypothetical protein
VPSSIGSSYSSSSMSFVYGFLESHLFIEGHVSANFNLMLLWDIDSISLG